MRLPEQPASDPLDRTLELLLTLGRDVQFKDLARASDCFRQAVELARTAGRTLDETRALVLHGGAEIQRGALAEAEASLDRALELARGSTDGLEIASCLNKLSLLRQRQGRSADGLAVVRDALTRTSETGDAKSDQVRGETLEMLGRVYRDRGDPAQALRYYQEALEIARAANDELAIAARLN